MGSINDYFDAIYCINLKHRTDRWETCEKQFQKFNMEVKRFEAINGKDHFPNGKPLKKTNDLLPGEMGVILSNYNIIKEAKEKKYKQILIFEDDVELDKDFDKKFVDYYKMVPKDWVFLYFGGNHVGGYNMVNQKIAKIQHTFAIHAFCVKEEAYDHILTMLDVDVVKEQVDVVYARLQKIFPSYVFRPHLAWQKDGHSDIQGGYQNYDFLKR